MRQMLSPRRIIGSALCLILTFAFVLRWREVHPRDDLAWKAIQAAGIIRIGMDASYPPFANTKGDTPYGLDVELAQEIAKRLGVKAQIENMGYDGLYDALQTKQVDILISALSFDPMRTDTFRFSRPYFEAGTVILARGPGFRDMPDLEGKTVAVEYGSSGDEVVRLWVRRLHQLTVVRYTSMEEAIAAAVSGSADAALADNVSARLYLHDHPGALVTSQAVAGDGYSIVMRFSSFELAGALDYALRDIMADGTLDAIIKRWM